MGYIEDFIQSVMNTYAPMGVINLVYGDNGIVSIANGIWAFVQSLWGVGADIFAIITDTLDFLPSSWIALITIMLGIVIALRVYSFVKDISILGFKI